MATLSEAEVFGATKAPPAANPRTMSEADVFPPSPAPVATGEFGPIFAEPWSKADQAPRLLPPPPATPPVKTPWTEDNPAFAAGDPREALPPSAVDWGKVGGAVRQGWGGPVSLLPPGSDDAGQKRLYGPYVGGAINTLFRFPLGLPNAALYGAAELAHQVTGDPRAAREVMRAAEMLPMHGSLAGPRVFAEPPVAPRVAPLMESFNRMDAARAAETGRPDRSWPLRFGDEPPAGTQAPAPPPEPPPGPPAAPGSAPLSTVSGYVDDYIAGKGRDDPKYQQFYANNGPEIEAEFRRRGEPSINESEAPAPGPTPEPPPIRPRPSEAPQPVGAQITPSVELGLTPQEEAAYRSTAEGNKLLEPQEPGVRDDKQYLTGERINEAQASQDVEVARELKSLREQTPELDKIMTADETHNNNIRANAINNAIPGPVQIGRAKKARTDAMAAAEPQVFGNASDADVAPIVKGIQDILNDPKNVENTQLQKYVRPLIDRLQNEDGTPKITNPLQLWGWRQDVQHLTSGAAQAADQNLSRVSGMLGKVLDLTDDRLEAAAPGYKARLRDDYRERSREIDAMEALNAEQSKLFDTQNKPNYNAVQRLMRRMIDARQANDPYDPFTHVTPETLDKLWNIRDSMRRQAAVDRLGAPRGSPTSQNLGDALRGAGKMALKGVAPVIGGTIGQAIIPIPGVGPAIGIAAGATVNHLLSQRGMAQRLVRGLELTNPNRLMNTGAMP